MKWALVSIFLTYLWINIPSFHDGLFHVIDNVQVTRVEAMYNELSSGQFPVRYFDAYGFGAGSFLLKFYSPLVYYFGAAFHYIGFSFIQSVKLIYLLMTAIGAISIFLLLRIHLKSLMASTFGTIAFLTAPYVYHDFFHRGSLAEATAFMLVPLVWLMFTKLKKQVHSLNIALGALSLGLVILAHSLTGVMVVGTLIVFILIPPYSKKNILSMLMAIILGFGLTSFSLIPSLTEKNLIQYENNSLLQGGYLDHPVPILEQFVGSPDGQSAHLGLALMVAYLVLLVLYIKLPALRKKYKQLLLFVLIIATGGLFLMDPVSRFLWEKIIYLRYFQFPFRLLTIVTSSLVVGYAIIVDYFDKSKTTKSLMALLIFVPLLLSHKYYQPVGYQYGTKYTVDDPCMTNTWANEYLSKWTSKCLLQPLPNLITPLSVNVKVNNVDVYDNGRTIRFNVVGTGDIQIGKYYFPEWIATDDAGNLIETEPYGESGLIKISVLNSLTRISVRMEPSVGSRTGDLISTLSLILCAILVLYHKNKKLI